MKPESIAMWYRKQNTNDETNNYILALHVKPKASRSQILGLSACGSYLEVAIKALPADGAANEELIKFLASTLKIPRKQCILKSGGGSRYKQVLVFDISESELRGILKNE